MCVCVYCDGVCCDGVCVLPLIELRRSNAGIPLRDHDQTNLKEGDWTKINTLGHYRLAEMVRERKRESYSNSGTIYIV